MKKLLILLMAMSLTACVTVQKPKPIVINGAAGYLQKILLPMNSMFTVAIIDLDTPGVILAQKTFNVATQPIPFKFILPAESIDKKVNYGVVALIKNQDRVIFQTYNRYPIINNGKTTVEVIMQPAK
ncbi:chaperone for general secretion pathway YbaY [Parashewanella curva]|uniref:Chaperone for general secretion pathway YbaY n=1 Tax=Parashewanella curva TaxID=2338552 RepID=A0A3L8PWK0_9GAMM|nr:YbaY family lipoprotein [Parashewanella curva]RLV59725.1 chaperone for general secretion pathway YbaY [Parashewanella curva]